MEITGTCRLCGGKLSFKPDNPYILGEHLVKKHPEVEMTFIIHDEDTFGKRPSRKSQSKISLFGKRSSSRSKIKVKNKNNLYKTTVETWRPGAAPILCPSCGSCEQPYLRKQRNKIAHNSLGAFFLMGCWPLCFIPMMMCGTSVTVACCRRCGYVYGVYNRRKGKLESSPNNLKRIDTPTPPIC